MTPYEAQVRDDEHLLREDEVLCLDVAVQDARPVHGRHRRRHLHHCQAMARQCNIRSVFSAAYTGSAIW